MVVYCRATAMMQPCVNRQSAACFKGRPQCQRTCLHVGLQDQIQPLILPGSLSRVTESIASFWQGSGRDLIAKSRLHCPCRVPDFVGVCSSAEGCAKSRFHRSTRALKWTFSRLHPKVPPWMFLNHKEGCSNG